MFSSCRIFEICGTQAIRGCLKKIALETEGSAPPDDEQFYNIQQAQQVPWSIIPMMAEASPAPTEIPMFSIKPTRCMPGDFSLSNLAIDESASDVEDGIHTHTVGITREEEAQSVEGEFGLS